MLHIPLPYGSAALPLTLEESRVEAVLTSGIEAYKPEFSPEELVRRALENPIGCPPLEQLSRGKKNVTIIASDHTRPVPSRLLMPPLLAQIRKGNPDAEITILIATGCHRNTTREELVAKFGPEIVEKEKIVVHNCDDEANLCLLGMLPSGGMCRVSRYAVEADLLLSEGFIEHIFLRATPAVGKRCCPVWRQEKRFLLTIAANSLPILPPGREAWMITPSTGICSGPRKRPGCALF